MSQDNTKINEEFTKQEQMDLEENEHVHENENEFDCGCGNVNNTLSYVDIQRDISLRTQINFIVEMSYMTVIGILLIAVRSDNLDQFDKDTGLLSILIICNIAFFFFRHNYLSKKYEINS